MKDYEYYKEEMNNGVIPVIEGTKGMEENLLLGRILTWLPRKIFGILLDIFKKKDGK